MRIRGALALDAPTYLKGMWAACRKAASANSKGGSDNNGSNDSGATWVRQSVDDIHALAASGEFTAVVACVGAGVKALAGVKDIVSLRLVRGQTLLYDNVDPQSPSEAASKLLTSAVLCGQYAVPGSAGGTAGKGGKILCGSTQEPVLFGDEMNKPPDMDKALRQLVPKVTEFFPSLKGLEPFGVTAGVRASTND